MRRKMVFFLSAVFALAVGMAAVGFAQEPPETVPPSLKTIPVPEPVNLFDFVKDKAAAIRLGKALFWDMQVGSDGVQACASCHFHSGADNRVKNQISPGLLGGDTTFQIGGPNTTVTAALFPTTQFLDPDRPGAELDPDNIFVRSTNDVLSSQGVRFTLFQNIVPGSAVDQGTPIPDDVFKLGSVNQRRVEPRNTPTVINAVFNFSNFWDGRARNIFNGVNPFGELDENARVFVNDPATGLTPTPVRIPDSSLASQAVGPPLSDFEMSWQGRTFAKLGRKMFSLKPLARQQVHPQDSVLGPLASIGRVLGLNTTYPTMIRTAFQDKWWNNTSQFLLFSEAMAPAHAPDQNDPRGFPLSNGIPTIVQPSDITPSAETFTQMEANFSLFFGLAVQLYEATLVSNDSKFDQVQEGRAVFSADEAEGLDIFMTNGKCINCHTGAEFTNHSVSNVRGGNPGQPPCFVADGAIEFMNVANQANVIYDDGFYNIGVRPTEEDVSRDGTAPFQNPANGNANYPLSFSKLAELKAQGLLPAAVAECVPNLPPGVPADNPVVVRGSQKAPGLRNAEITGPFFHNGGASTLKQVVEFYTRGGNFPVTNQEHLDIDIAPIGQLGDNPVRQDQLVAFLLTLTDERVRNEMAPFDHPQLRVPNGSPAGNPAGDEFIVLPAVGAGGRPASGLPPLRTFLGLSQFDSGAGGPPVGGAFSISGRVTSSLGSPLAGVTMTLTGAANDTTLTDGNGNYSFPNLANGSYTVTPSLAGFAFTPASRSVTISGANVTGQNFVGRRGRL